MRLIWSRPRAGEGGPAAPRRGAAAAWCCGVEPDASARAAAAETLAAADLLPASEGAANLCATNDESASEGAANLLPATSDDSASEPSSAARPWAEVRAGEAAALPYPDACFAAAFSVHSLHLWPDVPAGLRELARVVRPGGRLSLALRASLSLSGARAHAACGSLSRGEFEAAAAAAGWGLLAWAAAPALLAGSAGRISALLGRSGGG